MKPIERFMDGRPTIVSDKLVEGQLVENTVVGFGTIILDKDFLHAMDVIVNTVSDDKKLISLITSINNKINDYFYSKEINTKSRYEIYSENEVADEDGLIIGTKLSALKGKNVALCSEKSLAAYVILEKLYSMGSITRKPTFVLSMLTTNDSNEGPHAFVLLNKDVSDPTRNLLFDPENPTLIEDNDNNIQKATGLYSLTDAEYHDLINGLSCTPKSLYEFLEGYHEVSEKRIYGRHELYKNVSK